MGHVVLLGDSIFDNARYVPDRPPVVEQVRRALPVGWRAALLAVDGHTAEDVPGQLAQIPADASHLFVSAGGNDALGESSLLSEAAYSVGEALCRGLPERFRRTTPSHPSVPGESQCCSPGYAKGIGLGERTDKGGQTQDLGGKDRVKFCGSDADPERQQDRLSI
jgi:hypothetical protein